MSATEDDDALVRAELERRTPEPRARWRGELGTQLHHEAHRRAALRARPAHLWPLAGALAALGVVLLLLALTQV